MDITQVKIFKDPVHGYINVPTCYAKLIIDNFYFQRLRNIEQTGMRVLYPAAKHDRFSHSLGVFHLGQKAVEALRKDYFRDREEKELDEKEFKRCEILFLIACLLHDIGHTPFSHSLEAQILNNSKIIEHEKGRRKNSDKKYSISDCLIKTINEKEQFFCQNKGIDQVEINNISAAPHEQLGSYLILNKFCEAIKQLEEINEIWLAEEDFGDDLCFIIRMIMGINYREWSPKRQVRNCFIELLNGDNFDVDKLDYIVRDTQMSGINNVSVDVERLLGSLCIVKKTRYSNKTDLNKTNIKNLTISSISNNEENKCFRIAGNIKGIIKIKEGAVITIKSGSRFELMKGDLQELAEISYATGNIAKFSAATKIKEDEEWINSEEELNKQESFKQLRGKQSGKKFGVYIENAELKSDFIFKTVNEIQFEFFGQCNFKINGRFESVGSLKVFELGTLDGAISEIEVLGNTFEETFTKTKIATSNGYNTYSIGFKKQAINIVANVLEARNYLYLWVYAHHKVIYYANFLIPIIAKELTKHCGGAEFPSWELNYDNLEKLDDYYIWTAIKFLSESASDYKIKRDYSDLVAQLFSRNYNFSLYKSLAEFELVYASLTRQQRAKAVIKLQKQTNRNKPFLEGNKGLKYSAGFLKAEGIDKINEELTRILEQEDLDYYRPILKITELIFVVTEFKQKKLNTNKVYLDMGNEILPISQIPLLSGDSIANKEDNNSYFYLYYKKDNSEACSASEAQIIQESIKKFLIS